MTPVVAGDILVVSGTRKGTLGYKVANAGASLPATQVWHNTDEPMYMSSPVVDGTLVFGFSNRRKGQLFCLDANTGSVKWTTEGRAGTNALIRAPAATWSCCSLRGTCSSSSAIRSSAKRSAATKSVKAPGASRSCWAIQSSSGTATPLARGHSRQA